MATTTVTPINPDGGNTGIKSLDVNRYATKKTIAQGMLDIALLTANASQLKYILQVGKQHEFYILMLSLICTSIGLQAFVGVLYVIIGGLNINKSRDHRAALILNDLILLGVFLISLINIIISGFGMEQSNAHIAYQYSAAYNRKRNELYPEKATDSPN
nr:ninjurin-1-like isoform X4 [Neodiprion pinetum]XP_046474589.1 ninjurin-1-like isoform X4 [Neodiprion pinetum]XP_046474590.1 ninjurin-1-like isoform X4 [Neodiprion pinetum]